MLGIRVFVVVDNTPADPIRPGELGEYEMIVRINGKNEEAGKAQTLLDLVENQDYHSQRVVVEYNQRIIPQQDWQKVNLAENDNIEIISFMAGG